MHARVACAAAAIENAVPYAASRSSRRSGVVRLHCYRRDQEHHQQREYPEQNQARIVEPRRRARAGRDILEHEVHQRDDQARHEQHHRDGAVIGGQLPQDPGCGRRVAPQSYPARRSMLRLIMDRNASSSD